MAHEDWGALILDQSLDFLSVHDLKGDYLYASPACFKLLGYKPVDLVGTNAYDHFHPDDLDAILASHDASAGQAPSTLVQYRIKRKDGSYRWFETQSRTVEVAGRDVRIVAVSRGLDHRPPDEARLY